MKAQRFRFRFRNHPHPHRLRPWLLPIVSLLLVASADANPTWRLFAAARIPGDNTARFEGEAGHTTDGDLETAYGVRLISAIGNVGPEMHFTFLPVGTPVRRVKELRFHMRVEKSFVRNVKIRLSIGGLSLIPVVDNATLTDRQVVSWRHPSGLATVTDRIFVIIDARSTFRNDTNGINNLIGLREMEVIEEGQPVVEVKFGSDSMSTNSEGWPSPNPVSLHLTARCPVEAGTRCTGALNLELGSAGRLARFFVAETTFPGTEACSTELDDPDLHLSTRSYRAKCPAVDLAPGQVLGYEWNLWIQPSEASRLEARGDWRGESVSDDLLVPDSRVHPVVFLHGIQGSQPPADELIADNDRMLGRLDPFNGYYRPLLYQLQKMGYVWNESLFALAYDWRNSNRVSAAWLSSQLKNEILPRSQSTAVQHVNQDGQVDLIVHSMGGLVSRAYLQNEARTKSGNPISYGGEIRKIVFGATPHKGFPFDYQTWEYGDWGDYMDGSPVWPPAVMRFAMNENIWPRYVAKHYRPTSAELANDCFFVPFHLAGPLPVGAYVAFDFQGVIPGWRICRREVFIGWQHHPTRGVRSLFEMLPTNDTPRYLYDPTGSGPGPLPHEENTFLHTINSKIRFDLPNALGNLEDHVYVLLGDGAPETDVGYRVESPSPSAPELWRRGKVIGNVTVRDGSGNVITGDNLIPSFSACLRCGDSPLLPDLPAENEAILDASPGAPFRARHSPVLQHPETLKKRVPKWLAGYEVELPFMTDPDPPIASQTTLLVITNCPVNLLLTDPSGKRVGFEPNSGAVLREIDGAVYSPPGLEPQVVLVPAPLAGTYRVTMKGYGEGPVTVTSQFWSPGGGRQLGIFGSLTRVGLEESFELPLDPEAPYRPPVAVDDAFDVDADRPSLLDVLANDTHPEGGLSIPDVFEGPDHGTARVEEFRLRYTPDPGYQGSDELRYRISDGFSESTATVRIEVRGGANEPPVAADDGYASDPGGLGVPAPGVLENDSDPEGQPLSALLLTPPANGSVALNSDGSFDYTPRPGFVGSDSFTYHASDGVLVSNVATVAILVEAGNRPPVAVEDAFELDGEELVVAPPGVLGNDSDPERGSLAARLVTSPRHGVVALSPDGSFRYRARDNFPGLDVFTYAAFDGSLDSEPATVRIHRTSACDVLYGVDLVSDSLVRIDPATGRGALVGSLGIAVSSAGLAFRPNGDLWGLSMPENDAGRMLVYRIDTGTGAARLIHVLDLSADPRPLTSSTGLAFSSDGKKLFWLSGALLSVVDVEKGTLEGFPARGPLPISASSLTLPTSCHDLVAGDDSSGHLVRISAFDGAVEDVGATGLAEIGSLASSSDGSVFGESRGRLFRFDLTDGKAAEIGDLDFGATGLAFRPPFARSLCLDAGFDRRTGLSRWVIDARGSVRHLKGCPERDRCEKHGREDCKSCPRPSCGKCGAEGFYRLGEDAKLRLRTPEIPVSGRYRVRLQLRVQEKKARVRIRSSGERISFPAMGKDWHWTEWRYLELEKGVNAIELSADARIDVERVRIEQDCDLPCRGEQESVCLDRRPGKSALSTHVVEMDGRAGRRGHDGCCGGGGSYFVAGGDAARAGRIVAVIEVPRSGRYEIRFQYRTGRNSKEGDLLGVTIGGRSFDFRGQDLPASDHWSWSRPIEVELPGGRQRIEFRSTGRGRVELERIRWKHLCACGGPRE